MAHKWNDSECVKCGIRRRWRGTLQGTLAGYAYYAKHREDRRGGYFLGNNPPKCPNPDIPLENYKEPKRSLYERRR